MSGDNSKEIANEDHTHEINTWCKESLTWEQQK